MLDMIRKQFLIQKDDLIGSAVIAAGAGPVSYTHLDVYKRQTLLWYVQSAGIRARWSVSAYFV